MQDIQCVSYGECAVSTEEACVGWISTNSVCTRSSLYGTHCLYVQGEVPYGHHSLYSTHYSLCVQGGMPYMHHSLYYSHLHSYLLPRTGRGTISTVLPVLHTLSSYREAAPVHPSVESVPRPQTYLYVFCISCAQTVCGTHWTCNVSCKEGGRGCIWTPLSDVRYPLCVCHT